MQNEDDIQPVADETGMAADGFMNVSGSIPTGDISLKRSRQIPVEYVKFQNREQN